MRIALVSPYSWTIPGGVTRHVCALAEAMLARGHEVRVLAPCGAADAALPEWLVPLGDTVGLPFNGARSNLALRPGTGGAVLRELAAFGPDVVHLHEPVAPLVCWRALDFRGAPLVATFHTYGTSRATHGFAALCGSVPRMRRLAVRIAVSDAAAWTARSFYGGSAYRVIPNGVHLEPQPQPPPPPPERPNSDRRCPSDNDEDLGEWPDLTSGECAPLRAVFVGRAEARKGLPVLRRAVAELPGVELELVGVDGAASEAEKAAALARADVLVAPALGGESFGMVLTEAFAAGLPVVASDIPGYRGVVRDGVEGLLVPPGDPAALATALRALADDPARRAALASAGSRRAEAFAWPVVAAQVESAYRDALQPEWAAGGVGEDGPSLAVGARPEPATPAAGKDVPTSPVDPRAEPAARPKGNGVPSLAVAERPTSAPRRGGGAVPALAFLRSRRLPAPLPPLDGATTIGGRRVVARRAVAAVGALAVLVAAVVAVRHVGAGELATALVASSPGWTLAAFGLMAASLALRAVGWRTLLATALPDRAVGLAATYRATAIGVLMSATLPARLGEPARAYLAARKLGADAREPLPAVLGTMVAQTVLNVVALLLLAGAVLTGPGPWHDGGAALAAVAAPALALVVLVLAAPRLLSEIGAHRAFHGAFRSRGVARRLRGGLTAIGPAAVVAQLAAWALQWLGCWALLAALGVDAGAAAAAGVLLAVNVTAIVPLTPSNVGVFQAACVAVLTAHGVGAGEALAYGILLQAVEVATAVVLGVPALVREGIGWREVRRRALAGAASAPLAAR